MTQSEKEKILAKLQELTSLIRGVNVNEATLFDRVEPTISTTAVPVMPETESVPTGRPVAARARINDGTMTATTIASHLSKELGRTITRESVIRVGKHINAKPVYRESQHQSRYSPQEVATIMNLYRSFSRT